MGDMNVKGTFNVPASLQGAIPVSNVNKNAVPEKVEGPFVAKQEEKVTPKITAKGEYMVPEHLVDILMPITKGVLPKQNIVLPKVINVPKENENRFIADIIEFQQKSYTQLEPRASYLPTNSYIGRQFVDDDYSSIATGYGRYNYVYNMNPIVDSVIQKNILREALLEDTIDEFDNQMYYQDAPSCCNSCRRTYPKYLNYNYQNYCSPWNRSRNQMQAIKLFAFLAFISQMMRTLFDAVGYYDRYY